MIPNAIPSRYPLKIRPGCVLYMDMQDGGSKLIDHSGYSHHGVNYGSISVAGPGGLVRSFDGVDDYISLGHPAALNSPNAFTLEAWTKATVLPQGSGVITESYVSTVQYELGFGFNEAAGGSAKAKVGFFVGGTWYVAADSVDVAIGAWVHILGTWDGTTLKIYKMGKLVGSAVPGTTPTASTEPILVGRRHDSSGSKQYFPGPIGKVAKYNRTLPAAEIAEIFAEEAWRYGVAA